VVVQAGVLHRAVAVHHRVGTEVDRRLEEFLDQRAQGVGLGQAGNLVAELEVIEDFLDVGRKAVQIGLEVGLELLLAGAVAQVAQGELRGVVEGLAGCLAQRLILVGDTDRIQAELHVQHRLFGRLQHRVQAAQHGHGQNDVTILAAHIEVAQYVVGDAPDEVGDPVELGGFHLVVIRVGPVAAKAAEFCGLDRISTTSGHPPARANLF